MLGETAEMACQYGTLPHGKVCHTDFSLPMLDGMVNGQSPPPPLGAAVDQRRKLVRLLFEAAFTLQIRGQAELSGTVTGADTLIISYAISN